MYPRSADPFCRLHLKTRGKQTFVNYESDRTNENLRVPEVKTFFFLFFVLLLTVRKMFLEKVW